MTDKKLTKEEKAAQGIVEIHGKDYLTAARRVKDFRADHPELSLTTKVLSAAERVMVVAKIKDDTGAVLATGHAEEVRDATAMLTTSAIEVCETSAVGRCLSLYGYLGTEIAGAEEMEEALKQQQEMASLADLVEHNRAVREHIDSIAAIKAYLLNDQYIEAYESISEISSDDSALLWKAPSKGGIFTTREREQMKSNEWAQARKDHHNGEVE